MSESKGNGLTLTAIKTNFHVAEVDLSKYGFVDVEKPLKVTFRTNFWTVKAQATYSPKAATVADANIALILDAATEWNICTDDGKPIAITATFLREQLGYQVVQGIADAIMKSIHPNAETSGS